MPEPKKTAKGAPAESPKKKGRLPVVLIPAVIVAVGILGAAYILVGRAPAKAAGASTTTTTVAPGPTVGEPALTVNLSDGHYLQFTAVLQLAHGAKATPLSSSQARVVDMLIADASGQTETALTGPDGQAKFKAAIVSSLDGVWPKLVTTVYFTQFVMQ
jgi:flagellar FliL protein